MRLIKARKGRHEILDPAQPKLEQLGKSLLPAQQNRLWQITLQMYGPYVYDAQGMPTALGLNDTDIARINSELNTVSHAYEVKVDQYVKAHHVQYHLVGGDMMVPIETPEIRKINEEKESKLMAAMHHSLSKSQNERLSELLGAPFKLSG